MQSFEDCVTLHLLTVLPQDAAEQEKYYINIHLKKPSRVKISHFVARVEQLNSYLRRLPGLIDSLKAVKNTKQIEPFNKADLAQIILKMCPTDWQDQFSLSQGIIHQDMQSLLDVLEVIENCYGKKRKRDPMEVSFGKRIKQKGR